MHQKAAANLTEKAEEHTRKEIAAYLPNFSFAIFLSRFISGPLLDHCLPQ